MWIKARNPVPGQGSQRRTLAMTADAAKGTGSSKRINTLMHAFGLTTYLEVGVRKGKTLEAVRASQRIGVDPAHLIDMSSLPPGVELHSLASDAFFAELSDSVIFEFIFIDGLHTFEQSYRDVIHGLQRLSSTGLLLIDDVVPHDEQSASPSRDRAGTWMGDVYKTASMIAEVHPELAVHTLGGDGFRNQMLVWKVSPNTNVEFAGTDDVAARAHYTFSDVFSGGVPASFKSGSLEDALSKLRQRPPSSGPNTP